MIEVVKFRSFEIRQSVNTFEMSREIFLALELFVAMILADKTITVFYLDMLSKLRLLYKTSSYLHL
jgi:hypothetical protein